MLRRIAKEGLLHRYGDPTRRGAERLDFELGVIEDMGFASYFLIVWDFVRFAKENGIAVGPGRGSAAGSIVAYSLDITDIDPLANDLLFERFLNPGRKSMPDIDIDFSVRGRERVIRYVAEKYGRESVAQIITFGKMAPRAATRDAARVLGYDYATGDRLAKLIPEPILGRNPSFEECLKPGEELKRTYDAEPDARRILDTAQGLEGIVRNNSIHAAAVVIADRPLQEIVPLQLAEDRGAAGNGNGNGKAERAYKIVTQYSMGPIEEIGLLKMDFLGLRNLDVIEDAVEIIERSRGERSTSRTSRSTTPRPTRCSPAGTRSASSSSSPRGCARRCGRCGRPSSTTSSRWSRSTGPARCATSPTTPAASATPRGPLPRRAAAPDHRAHLRLRHLPGAADGDRQADGRLQPRRGRRPAQGDRQEEARPDGDDEGQVHGGPERLRAPNRVAQDLWSLMEAAADYSFNKSHAACYALIAYRTAYLKANYPAEYMAAVISSVMNTKDKVPFFVNRCEEMGIEVLPPDVNSSDHGFVVSENSDPLRPRRGEERRPRGGRGDPRCPRGAARSARSGTSASGSTAARSTSARSSA